ncbi:MAG: hypothetical protein LN413_00315 [Candidatus Thermoplasmatota archaeon]|nr:hypothetical protein [Candidatus Thermoplasmatota archaeon]
MSRFLAAGSVLNQIWGSTERWPELQVLVWNPNETTISQVATGQARVRPVDISSFVERVQYSENIGYESLSNPQVTSAAITFKSDDGAGILFRRGYIEDGVIVRILQGDTRVVKEGWLPLFTGTFRGVPGIDPGTRATASEGMSAIAQGREERYLNRRATTRKYPTEEALEADPDAMVDIGVLAADITQRHMNLTQDEVLFGAFGFVSKHKVNQIVDLPVLQGIAECMFPVRKKPKFDELGRLKAVDVDFDKPPVRVFRDGDALIRSVVRSPNDAEVATRVILKGLAANLSRVGPTKARMLNEIKITVGFWNDRYHEDHYYSQDRMLRARNTDVHTKKEPTWPFRWAAMSWDPDLAGAFKNRRGTLNVDLRFIARFYQVFALTWIGTKLAAYTLQIIAVAAAGTTPAEKAAAAALETTATGLHAVADAILALLLYAMQFLGRGRYQIWGIPFEEVYQELESRAQLSGLDEEELRTIEFTNHFLSDLVTLNAESRARLRRELVKDQVHAIEMMDDPALEVDDIIEISPEPGLVKGDRFYIVTVSKTLERAPKGTMKLITWKIADGLWSEKIEPLQLAETT